MKVLVVLCAVVAGGLAQGLGYGYSAISPLTGYSNIVAPFSYAYSAPIISAVPYAAPLSVPVKTQYHSQNELGVAQYGHDEPGQSHHAVQDALGNKFGSFSYIDNFGGIHKTSYVADEGGYRVASNDLPIGPVPLIARKKRQAQWNGPPAQVRVSSTGHLVDTPEVQAAKQAHQAEVDRQSRQQTQQPNYAPQAWQSKPQPWNQPQAVQNDFSSSSLWSSAQAAPAARFNSAAAVPTPQWNQPQAAPAPQTYSTWSQQPAQSWNQPQAARAQSWSPPQQAAVIPTVNRDGTLADTPEIAQAKAEHARDFNKAAIAAANAPETSGPAQFPSQAQDDDGSYKPSLYDAPSQPAVPTWGQQSWSQGAESRSWDQPQATAAPAWNQAPAATWGQQPAAAAPSPSWPQATPYSAAPAASQSWQQPQADTSGQWNQQAATPSWQQPKSWEQPQAKSWEQTQSWNEQPQSWNQRSWDQGSTTGWNQPQAGLPQDTPEVAAAKAEHLRLHASAARA